LNCKIGQRLLAHPVFSQGRKLKNNAHQILTVFDNFWLRKKYGAKFIE
jgi:hypothetical protein